MTPLSVKQLKRGDRVRGFYRGVEFTGTIETFEGDRSGHRGRANDARLYVKNDGPIEGRNIGRREAGEGIILPYDSNTGRFQDSYDEEGIYSCIVEVAE